MFKIVGCGHFTSLITSKHRMRSATRETYKKIATRPIFWRFFRKCQNITSNISNFLTLNFPKLISFIKPFLGSMNQMCYLVLWLFKIVHFQGWRRTPNVHTITQKSRLTQKKLSKKNRCYFQYLWEKWDYPMTFLKILCWAFRGH